jgi:4-amino-4-deoxy-L-arabinose transferase-like glycosyltransferase
VTEVDSPSVAVEDLPAPPNRREIPHWVWFWRSPDGQPRWARPALLGIAAVAAVLYAWRIRDSGYALFYSVAVKSMSVSWKAFFYGAIDPGATITIDKLAGSFIPQALSARIFGYHAWSLTLPQVIEGVIAVLAMYRIGRRWRGPVVGLFAAGLFGLTPVVASMFGHPMEDGMLTMCLVLAADAFQRAVLEARLRSLLWSGFWIGIGFQAKMMQAWMIVPALAITYLVAAPASWKRRLAQLGLAGAVLLAVSLSWVMLYTVTPAADRPYVDASTNNSAFAMVFGYNGFDRFGVNVPGSVGSMFGGSGNNSGGPQSTEGGPAQGEGQIPGGTAGDATPGGGQIRQGGGGPGGGGNGATKLIGDRYGSQIGWLYPLALLGLVFGLISRGRSPRTDPARAGYLLWGLWLVSVGAVFSRIEIPHTAYMASLAPPLAALSGAAIVSSWRGMRDGTARWMLPVLVVAELAWTLYLSSKFPTFLPWLRWAVGIAGTVAVVVLVAVALVKGLRGDGPGPRRYATVGAMVLAVAAMVAVPTVWAGSVLSGNYSGSAFDASAGPASTGGFGGGGNPGSGRNSSVPNDIPAAIREEFQSGNLRGGGNGGFAGPGGGTTDQLTDSEQKLYAYLVAHRNGATYIAAVDSWTAASPYILATGQTFMPMGGFSGSVPQPTLAAVKSMVSGGRLRYFMLSGSSGLGRRGGGSGSVPSITSWVESTCQQVPAGDYGGTDQSGQNQNNGGFGGGGAISLYRCGS